MRARSCLELGVNSPVSKGPFCNILLQGGDTVAVQGQEVSEAEIWQEERQEVTHLGAHGPLPGGAGTPLPARTGMPTGGGKKAFTTTIKRVWFEEKMKDARLNAGLFEEYKDETEHWNKRIGGLDPPCPGVYLIGSEVFRFTVLLVRESQPLETVPDKYKPALNGPRVWVVVGTVMEAVRYG